MPNGEAPALKMPPPRPLPPLPPGAPVPPIAWLFRMEVLVRFCVPPSDVIKAPPWPLPPDPPTPPDAGPAGPADCLIVDQQAIVEVERAK